MARTKPWRWYQALHKMMAVATRRHSDLTYIGHIKPEHIRALARIQQGHCIVTGMAMELPQILVGDDNGKLPWGTALHRHRFNRPGLAPAIVKIDLGATWTVSNIVLIVTAMVPMYELCGGYAETVAAYANWRSQQLPNWERLLINMTPETDAAENYLKEDNEL